MKKNTLKIINLRHRKSMSGLSLIEILVTVVVLSIGLLGIAGLQAFGMRYNNDSYIRTQAVGYANELVERMHANPDAVNAGAYKSAMDVLGACATAGDPASTVNAAPKCAGNADAEFCDITQMASLDVFRMRCGYAEGTNLLAGVTNQLPLGNIAIACNDADISDANPCTGDSTRTITVSWQDPNDKGNASARLGVEINAQFL